MYNWKWQQALDFDYIANAYSFRVTFCWNMVKWAFNLTKRFSLDIIFEANKSSSNGSEKKTYCKIIIVDFKLKTKIAPTVLSVPVANLSQTARGLNYYRCNFKKD